MNVSKFRLYFNVIICALGMLFALPNVLPDHTLKQLPTWIPCKRVPLGLDLKGGTHLLLEMDSASLEQNYCDQIIENIQRILSNAGKTVVTAEFSKSSDSINIVTNSHIEQDVIKKIKTYCYDLNPEIIFTSKITETSSTLTVSLSKEVYNTITDEALSRAIEIVRRRVDSEGTREISLTRHGTTQIALQIPGIQNPETVKELLGKTAQLAFHLVDERMPVITIGQRKTHSISSVYMPLKEQHAYSSNSMLAVKKRAALSGSNLKTAKVSNDAENNVVVDFEFNNIGAEIFADLTSRNIGKRLAIVLDNVIISAPKINSAIIGGKGNITGNFSIEEANELSVLLRSGSLPAPLNIVEEQTVGAELGSDSITSGIHATLISVLFIMLFMLYEYGILGIAANVALFFNLIFLIAALSIMQATLTLPGIAGIALTLCMAIDANVLINERIREDSRKGFKLHAAIESGYKRAIITIVDSNLTTIFGGIALYMFGVGAVRGFAVTLILGVLISMFTAISLTKIMINLYFVNKKSYKIVY